MMTKGAPSNTLSQSGFLRSLPVAMPNPQRDTCHPLAFEQSAPPKPNEFHIDLVTSSLRNDSLGLFHLVGTARPPQQDGRKLQNAID